MSKLESKVIAFLRFPLIVGVIFIHSYSSVVNVSTGGIGVLSKNTPYLRELISQVFSRISVPALFFISGFLFFNNVSQFDFKLYLNKLKSRLRTLVVPMIFWNLLIILLYYFVQSLPRMAKLFSGNSKLIKDFSTFDFFNQLFGLNTTPISYQFWFVRDLFIFCLFSPLLYFLLKKIKFSIFLIGIIWYFQIIPNFTGIFFFTFGCYFSIYDVDFLSFFKKFDKIGYILYAILATLDLLTKGMNYNWYIHSLGILFGVISILNLSAYLLKKQIFKENVFLSEASFFIFAMHEPLLTFLRKGFFILLKPKVEVTILGIYFASTFIVIVIGLFSFYTLKRLFPKFTKIITGGRG